MILREKAEALKKLQKNLPPFVIAFSGGVDSGLLAAAAVRAGHERVLAVTLRPPWVPEREYRDAASMAEFLNLDWHCIPMDFPEVLRDNPEDRCYLCKTSILRAIKDTAVKSGATVLVDGSNADDSNAHRPGKRALEEFGVISPLAECGFSKSDVRALAKEYGLPIWNKPAYSCLLTRFPHGRRVSRDQLSMVEKGEDFLINEGFPAVRLRSHDELARIEIPPEERDRFCTPERMDKVSRALKSLGYRYVSLDLEGYRCGKMDKADTE